VVTLLTVTENSVRQSPVLLKFKLDERVPMPKKHRVKNQVYMDHLKKLEKERDAKTAYKEAKKRARDERDETVRDAAPQKPSAQSAVAVPLRSEEGEQSKKKVRTEK
jgi:hypothetical protein